jgi:hypothetical protein
MRLVNMDMYSLSGVPSHNPEVHLVALFRSALRLQQQSIDINRPASARWRGTLDTNNSHQYSLQFSRRFFSQSFHMAYYLFKLIRRKIKENEAKKAIPTTDESHLMLEITSGSQTYSKLQTQAHDVASTITPAQSHVDHEEAARQKAESRKRNIRQLKLMAGLALPNFLASLDVTIVAPAIPLISSHFSKPSLIPTSTNPCTNSALQTTFPAVSIGLSPPTH